MNNQINVNARLTAIWDRYKVDGDRAAQVLSLKELIWDMKAERDRLVFLFDCATR